MVTPPSQKTTAIGSEWQDLAEDMAASRQDHENVQYRRWLHSSNLWSRESRPGEGWFPKRVLGKGGQGIVGHWRYEGPRETMPAVTDVVVKQGDVRYPGGGLEREAGWMTLLNQSSDNSQHIIRMYRQLYMDTGAKTIYPMDFDRVARLYMEYCPGGDLRGWLKAKQSRSEIATEIELWQIFHCLSLALLVIAKGHESLQRPAWTRDEIVHFDLKHENILIGEETIDQEHDFTAPHKIADFGLATEVPKEQDDNFHRDHRGRGTKNWLMPEQIDQYTSGYPRPWCSNPWGSNYTGTLVRDTTYGMTGNVWQIGLIMWCLMHTLTTPPFGKPSIPSKQMVCYQSTLSSELRQGGKTVGWEEDIEAQRYVEAGVPIAPSKTLRKLIAECLLIHSPNRPSPATLVQLTKAGLQAAKYERDQMMPAEDMSAATYLGRAGQEPEYEYEAIGPFMSIECIIETPRGYFTRARDERIKIDTLKPTDSFFALKMAIHQAGCSIRITKMLLYSGTTVFQDHQQLSELGVLGFVRVREV